MMLLLRLLFLSGPAIMSSSDGEFAFIAYRLAIVIFLASPFSTAFRIGTYPVDPSTRAQTPFGKEI